MSEKKWVDGDHYRITSEDGKTSQLFKADGGIFPDTCIEIADHHSDGTTDAYEFDYRMFHSVRGAHK